VDDQKKLVAPEPKESIEPAPALPELDSAPAEPELPAAPAVAELPVAESSDHLLPPAHKKPKNLLAALVVVAIVLLASAGAAAYLLSNTSDNRSAETEEPTTPEETEPVEPAETPKYLTHTTDHNKLSFDYPNGWKVSSESEEISDGLKRFYTYVESPNGHKLQLTEDEMGGIGGYCVPEEAPKVQVHKEADTKTTGVVVVSYVQPYSGSFSLHASVYSGPYDTEVSGCSTGYDEFFTDKINTKDALVSFTYTGTERPAEADFAEIVKVLSSLRQGN
jgi:hypothetical protein